MDKMTETLALWEVSDAKAETYVYVAAFALSNAIKLAGNFFRDDQQIKMIAEVDMADAMKVEINGGTLFTMFIISQANQGIAAVLHKFEVE